MKPNQYDKRSVVLIPGRVNLIQRTCENSFLPAAEWEIVRWLSQSANQSRTPASTSANCCPVSLPRNRSAFTVGTVTGFCTRNAPALRNGTLICTSRSEPRKGVTCGTTLMSAPPDSLKARLRIRAGRAFWTMPRSSSTPSGWSTNSTSRRGSSPCRLRRCGGMVTWPLFVTFMSTLYATPGKTASATTVDQAFTKAVTSVRNSFTGLFRGHR